jgi:hypothetical protein
VPFKRSRYPANWEAFTHGIKVNRAAGRCECTGECGLHQAKPNIRRCVEIHGAAALHFKGRVALTTAHLCKCDPPCANAGHVKAMCQRCHLRMDGKAKWARRQARLRLRRAALEPITEDLGLELTNLPPLYKRLRSQ